MSLPFLALELSPKRPKIVENAHELFAAEDPNMSGRVDPRRSIKTLSGNIAASRGPFAAVNPVNICCVRPAYPCPQVGGGIEFKEAVVYIHPDLRIGHSTEHPDIAVRVAPTRINWHNTPRAATARIPNRTQNNCWTLRGGQGVYKRSSVSATGWIVIRWGCTKQTKSTRPACWPYIFRSPHKRISWPTPVHRPLAKIPIWRPTTRRRLFAPHVCIAPDERTQATITRSRRRLTNTEG